ncbi:hypothetical protein HC931_22355 [Candidatus Gracilibacteria bacterium]|nr:hypothetical protein [Candidatus Gracilibacteria bacterium]
MSDSEKMDLNFRYRPNVDSPDAILIRYLKSYKPSTRKELILKALRAFYLVAAYGEFGSINSPSELESLARSLKETYGDDYKDTYSFGVEIELDIHQTGFWGSAILPGRESDDENEDYGDGQSPS